MPLLRSRWVSGFGSGPYCGFRPIADMHRPDHRQAMSRDIIQRTAEPQLTAEVTLYATSEGGRKDALRPGLLLPCMISKGEPLEAWDGLPLLRDVPLYPGETRHLGFVFLSGKKAADALRAAGKFYLWDGRLIGEAVVTA